MPTTDAIRSTIDRTLTMLATCDRYGVAPDLDTIGVEAEWETVTTRIIVRRVWDARTRHGHSSDVGQACSRLLETIAKGALGLAAQCALQGLKAEIDA